MAFLLAAEVTAELHSLQPLQLIAFQDDFGKFTWNNFEAVKNAFVYQDQFCINLKDSLVRSWILWLVGEGICFPISLITTYVLTRKIAGHYIFRICYIVPSLMGAIIWTLLIKEMVRGEGPITLLAKSFGLDPYSLAGTEGLLWDEATAFFTIVSVRAVMGFVGNSAVFSGHTGGKAEVRKEGDLYTYSPLAQWQGSQNHNF